MKYALRILTALLLIIVVTRILYPYHNFMVEHAENYFSGRLKLNWMITPILIRLILGLGYSLGFLLIFYSRQRKWTKYLAPAFLVLPFIINSILPKEFRNIAANIDLPIIGGVKINSNEPHVLAIYSSSCGYCKESAKRLKAAQAKSDKFPKVHVVSAAKNIDQFFNETDTQFDYSVIPIDSILKYTNASFPKYYLVENGKMTKFYMPKAFSYYTLQMLSK